jgi:hypothetical protein
VGRSLANKATISRNIAWNFEGEPTTLREKRRLELYMK